MNDEYSRRKLAAGILVTTLLLIILIGEAMRDRTLRRWAFAYLCVIVFGLGMIVTCVWLLVSPVLAHDHERPELNQWFMQLHSGRGLCCDGGEALHLRDIEWETQDKADSHYRVKIPVTGEAYEKARRGEDVETMWVDVPDTAVVDEPNKAGAALVWPLYGYLGATVRCFMPGAMT